MFTYRKWLVLIVMLASMIVFSGEAAAQGRDCSALNADPLTLGMAALADANYEGAMTSFLCAIDADPSSIEAYGGLIEADICAGQYALAVEHAESLKGASRRGRLVYGTLIGAYRDQIEATPDDPFLYLLRGFYNSLVENEDVALRDAERAIQRDATIPFAYLLRGSVTIYESDPQDALADFEHAAELAPENASINEFAAIMCEDAVEVECATHYISRAFEMGITAQTAYMTRAKIQDLAGNSGSAAPDYLTFVQHFSPDVIEGEALQLGTPLMLMIEPAQAYQLTFEAASGQEVTFRTESDFHFIDPVMVLLAPDGTPLRGSDDAYNVYNSAIYNFVPETSGTYTLLVTTYNGAYSGEIGVIAETAS